MTFARQAFDILAKHLDPEGKTYTARALEKAAECFSLFQAPPPEAEGLELFAINPIAGAEDDGVGMMTVRYRDELEWVVYEYDGVTEFIYRNQVTPPPKLHPHLVPIRDIFSRMIDLALLGKPRITDTRAEQVRVFNDIVENIREHWPIFDGDPVDEEWPDGTLAHQKILGRMLGREIRDRVEMHHHEAMFNSIVDEIRRAL